MAREKPHVQFRMHSVVDIPFLVLENAYWRPQAAKLSEKHLRRLGTMPAQKTVLKNYQKLRLAWIREETWVKYSLDAILMAFSEAMLSSIVRTLLDGFEIANPRLATLGPAAFGGRTGDPDLILVDSHAVVLGEAKVAAHQHSHKYSFGQYTKYMTLAAICKCARNSEMKRRACHVILVPDEDPKSFVQDYDQWRPIVKSKQLFIDPDKIRVRDKSERFTRFISWRQFITDTLRKKPVSERCDIDGDILETLCRVDSPAIVPTYIVTWRDLTTTISDVAKATGMVALAAASEQLHALAYGEYQPHLEAY